MRDVHGKPLIYIVSTFASATLHTQRNSGIRQMVTPPNGFGFPHLPNFRISNAFPVAFVIYSKYIYYKIKPE